LPDHPAGEVDVDPSATPWRVLEDPPTDRSDKAAAVDPDRVRAIGVPRSAIVAGGLSAVLAIGAFVVAFGSSTSGSVVVDGGLPLDSGLAPVASGGAAVAGTSTGGDLVVEIVGAIDRPGVFRLPAGSRIGDLVSAAGGYGPRVDADRAGRELNLAALLRDGDQVRVPSRDDTPSTQTGGGPAASGSTSTGPIDLNAANAEQLDALPGIGPVTAAKILASRDEQPFAAVADLRTRKLVGEKTFEQLKDLVTVR
jgi:competence protein ComEA